MKTHENWFSSVNITVLSNCRVWNHIPIWVSQAQQNDCILRLIIRLRNYQFIKYALGENIIQRNPSTPNALGEIIIQRNPSSPNANTIPSLYFPSAPVSQQCGFPLVSLTPVPLPTASSAAGHRPVAWLWTCRCSFLTSPLGKKDSGVQSLRVMADVCMELALNRHTLWLIHVSHVFVCVSSLKVKCWVCLCCVSALLSSTQRYLNRCSLIRILSQTQIRPFQCENVLKKW